MSNSFAQQSKSVVEDVNKTKESNLIAIVLHHNRQLTHPPRKARITSVDTNGLTIEYRYVQELVWNASGEKKRQRVTFAPAIKDASEIPSRLASMSQEATKAIPKQYPVLYSVPRDLPVAIVILLALTLLGNPSLLAQSPPTVIKLLTPLRDRLGGVNVFSVIWKGYVAAHAAESALMAYNNISRKASPSVTIKWILTHFFIGFPNFWAFGKLNPDAPSSGK